jgi:hypothetical protein
MTNEHVYKNAQHLYRTTTNQNKMQPNKKWAEDMKRSLREEHLRPIKISKELECDGLYL